MHLAKVHQGVRRLALQVHRTKQLEHFRRPVAGVPKIVTESSCYRKWHASDDNPLPPIAVRVATRRLAERMATRRALKKMREHATRHPVRQLKQTSSYDTIAAASICHRKYVQRLHTGTPPPLAFRLAARQLRERAALRSAMAKLKLQTELNAPATTLEETEEAERQPSQPVHASPLKRLSAKLAASPLTNPLRTKRKSFLSALGTERGNQLQMDH